MDTWARESFSLLSVDGGEQKAFIEREIITGYSRKVAL
jgi:hypothetical protein